MAPTDAGTTAELREALALPAPITVGGKEFKVRCLTFGEYPDAIERLAPAVERAFAQGVDLARHMLAAGLVKEGQRIRLDSKTIRELTLRSVPLVATLPSALRFLQWMCATCTDQQLGEVQKLSPDDGIKLSEKVVEVNHDFFVRRMLPLLKGLLTRLPGSVSKSSESAESTASSSPATPTSSSA
jgi:hypothetical protein